jgi:hypothetical protein
VVVPFLVVVTTAISASALEGPGYGDLRAESPQIARAVGSMPANNLHGSFNRISALLQSSPVRHLDAGSSEFVPVNVERNLVLAIETLGTRMLPDALDIDAEDRLALLQTLKVAVFRPLQELYSDASWEFCPAGAADCDSPEVLIALDRLAQDLLPVYWSLISYYEEAASEDSSLPAVVLHPDDEHNSQAFGSIVDELSGFLGLVHGEPIID